MCQTALNLPNNSAVGKTQTETFPPAHVLKRPEDWFMLVKARLVLVELVDQDSVGQGKLADQHGFLIVFAG